MTTMAELAQALEAARKTLHSAQANYEIAGTEYKAAVQAVREAYKAFTAAVAAMKPKRPRKEKPAPAQPNT